MSTLKNLEIAIWKKVGESKEPDPIEEFFQDPRMTQTPDLDMQRFLGALIKGEPQA